MYATMRRLNATHEFAEGRPVLHARAIALGLSLLFIVLVDVLLHRRSVRSQLNWPRTPLTGHVACSGGTPRTKGCTEGDVMHTPNPGTDPHPDDRDDEQPDVRQPVVPPDQAPDVVPQRDPPKPGQRPEPPMVV